MGSKKDDILIKKNEEEEENLNKNSNIECIVEEDSDLMVKQEYDEQDENQMNQNSSNSSTINQNNQGQNNSSEGGRNGNSQLGQNLDSSFNAKRSVPVVKMYYGKKYVVGMCSHQEQEIESEEDEKPIHYYPPKLILLNFPRPHNYDAQTQLLLIENSQFQAKFQEMNQNQDLTTYLEQLVVGNSLNYAEKLEVRRFWFARFFEYAQRHPPCCKRVKKFWDWVFMLNPESNFKWRFKSFSLQWIELMTSYVEFRELFSIWLESFEQDILSELQEEKKKLFKAQLYSRYFKELLQMRNKSSFVAEDVESREDMQNQIINDGVVIKPEGYKESCICKRSERDIRIGMVPKLNKVQFKYNMKIFQKNSDINSLFTIKEAELPVNPPEDNFDDEDDEDDDEDDPDLAYGEDIDYDRDNSSIGKGDESSSSSQSEISGDSNNIASQNSINDGNKNLNKSNEQRQQKSGSPSNLDVLNKASEPLKNDSEQDNEKINSENNQQKNEKVQDNESEQKRKQSSEENEKNNKSNDAQQENQDEQSSSIQVNNGNQVIASQNNQTMESNSNINDEELDILATDDYMNHNQANDMDL